MVQQHQRHHLSSDELTRCVGMLEGGCTQTHLANILGVSQSVVSRAWTRYHAFGTAMRRHAAGRQQATTHREDRFIALQACRNRFSSARSLRSDLLNATGTMSASRLSGTDCMMSIFATEDPAFMFHSLRNMDGNDWPELKIMSTGLLLTGPRCCSVMSRNFVWTTLMVALEFGAGQERGIGCLHRPV